MTFPFNYVYVTLIVFVVIILLISYLLYNTSLFSADYDVTVNNEFGYYCNQILRSISNIKYDEFQFNQYPQKAKIAILTLEDRTAEYIECHHHSVKKYCDKHGYTYIFQPKYDSKLPIYWHKLQFVKDHLKNYDYILWLDSDTIIYNDEIRLESIINGYNHLYIGADYPGHIVNPYCSGIFLIRNSKESFAFIDDCLNNYLNNPACLDINGNYKLNGGWAGMCYEQGVMNYMLKDKYKHIVRNIPVNIFTSDYNLDKSNFILHRYGHGKEKLHEIYQRLRSNQD